MFRDLSLLWKLLVPFLVLMLLAGTLGAFVIVRDLSSRAEAALEEDLSRRSLNAAGLLKERELYLLESVNLAANLQGVAPAVAGNDAAAVIGLLRSVLALKTELTLLTVTDARGRGVREFRGRAGSDGPQAARGTRWAGYGFVRKALRDPTGAKTAGLLRVGRTDVIAVAGAVCSNASGCAPVGAAIAGIAVERLAAEAAAHQPSATGADHGAALYDVDGRLLGASGLTTPGPPPAQAETGAMRRIHQTPAGELATAYTPLDMQGQRVGTLAVTVPTAPAFASAREAGLRLAVILLAATVGVLIIGAFVSRLILAQVRPLIATNRALGAGDLSVRAPVLGDDELGELARGVNQMAAALQSSHETLEQRVVERTEQVSRLLRERTEFFAGMSHELRTPLAVILNRADVMIDPSFRKTQAWSSQAGVTLRESAEQLLTLVDDILGLAKAEAGGLEVNLVEERLDDVVDGLRDALEQLAADAGLALRLDVPVDLPPVLADRFRLREIIQNLVDNAVKYTPGGGKVELSAEHRGAVVEVRVCDTGVGIPAEAGQHIFEPFYRVKGVRAHHGKPSSGLGLALANRLVDAHGGEISFTSTPGQGSTFTFTLLCSPAAQ